MQTETTVNKIWRIIYPVGIHMLLGYAVTFAGLYILMASNAVNNEDRLTELLHQYTSLFTAITAGIAIPVMVYFLRQDIKGQRISLMKNKAGNRLADWVMVVIIAAASGIWVNNVIALSGIMELFSGYQEVSQALYSGSLAVEMIGLAFLVPVAEELIFRGLVYQRLKRYLNQTAAVVLTSLGFAIYHGNVVQGVYAFCFSLLFIYFYETTGSLKGAVLGHIAVNLCSVILTSLPIGGWMYQSFLHVLVSTGGLICLSLFVFCIYNKRKN